MYRFELSEIEKMELDNCDNDIKDVFLKFGGGYHKKLPSFIQLNRNLKQLNENIKLLLNKSQKTKNSSQSCNNS